MCYLFHFLRLGNQLKPRFCSAQSVFINLGFQRTTTDRLITTPKTDIIGFFGSTEQTDTPAMMLAYSSELAAGLWHCLALPRCTAKASTTVTTCAGCYSPSGYAASEPSTRSYGRHFWLRASVPPHLAEVPIQSWLSHDRQGVGPALPPPRNCAPSSPLRHVRACYRHRWGGKDDRREYVCGGGLGHGRCCYVDSWLLCSATCSQGQFSQCFGWLGPWNEADNRSWTSRQ